MAQVQLTTDVKNYGYSKVQAAGSFPVPVPTLTQPTSAVGHLVIGGNANYLKLQVYSEQTTATNCRIYGWNLCRDLGGSWIPQILYTDAISANTPDLTLFGSSSVRSRIFGSANGTNVNVKSIGTAVDGVTGAMLIVDCLGAQFISIMLQSANATSADVHHVLHSSI